MKRSWVVVGIIFIILLIVGFVVFAQGAIQDDSLVSQEPTPTPVDVDRYTSPTPASLAAAVTVGQQQPGKTVVLSFVRLAKPGFVAIQFAGGGPQGSVPGMIVGSSEYIAAKASSVEIPITIALVPGQKAYAVPYADNGDKEFAAPPDAMVVDEYKRPLAPQFTVLSDSEVVVSPTPTITGASGDGDRTHAITP